MCLIPIILWPNCWWTRSLEVHLCECLRKGDCSVRVEYSQEYIHQFHHRKMGNHPFFTSSPLTPIFVSSSATPTNQTGSSNEATQDTPPVAKKPKLEQQLWYERERICTPWTLTSLSCHEYECMCVWLHVFMSACVHGYNFTCAFVYMTYKWGLVCISVCISLCISVYVRPCVHSSAQAYNIIIMLVAYNIE